MKQVIHIQNLNSQVNLRVKEGSLLIRLGFLAPLAAKKRQFTSWTRLPWTAFTHPNGDWLFKKAA